MQQEDFTLTFMFDQSPKEVFDAVCNVRAWWSESLEGQSAQLNDVFIYRHGDIHYSKHQLTEVKPNEKVVWDTLDSRLSFVEKQNEWNGTRLFFEISSQGHQTKLVITHKGLVPSFQCYEGCSKGWTYYLSNSLVPLITTGKGQPDLKNK